MSHRACRRSPPAAGRYLSRRGTPYCGPNREPDETSATTACSRKRTTTCPLRGTGARSSRAFHAMNDARRFWHGPCYTPYRQPAGGDSRCFVPLPASWRFLSCCRSSRPRLRPTTDSGPGAATGAAGGPPRPARPRLPGRSGRRRGVRRPRARNGRRPHRAPSARRHAVRRRRGPRRKDAARGPCRAARRKPQPHDRRRDPRDPHPARPPDRRTGRNRRPEERERYHGARRKPRPHARRRGRRAHLPDARSRRPEEPERCRGARRKPQPAAPGGRAASSGIARTRGGGNPYRSAGASAAGGRR